jgi:hypothetical protein
MFEPSFSFSSEIEENPKKQPTNFFLAKLSGRSTSLLVLEENEVLADGDCGFTALGVSRKTLTQELRTAGRSLRHRQFLSEEIASAFMLKELKPPDVLWQPLEEAYQANPTEETRKALYDYCYQPSVFNYYVDALSQHLWLGYKSALLYAESANITLYIWRKDEKQQGHLVLLEKHEAEDSPSNVIHMLHTHGFTHFNLLSESPLHAWEDIVLSESPSSNGGDNFDHQTVGNRLSVESAVHHYTAVEEVLISTPKVKEIDPMELLITALKEGGVPFYSPPLPKKESSRYFALVKLLVRDESLNQKEMLAAEKARIGYEKLYPSKRDLYRFTYAKQTFRAIVQHLNQEKSSIVTLQDYTRSVLKQLAEEQKGIEKEFETRLVERMKPLYEQWGWDFEAFRTQEKRWLLTSCKDLWPTHENELSSNKYYALADIAALDDGVSQLEEQASKYETAENNLLLQCERQQIEIQETLDRELKECYESRETLLKTIFEKDMDGTPKGLPRGYRECVTQRDLRSMAHQVDPNATEENSGSNLASLAIRYRNNDIYIFLRDDLRANINKPDKFGLTAHDYERAFQPNPIFESHTLKNIVQNPDHRHYSRYHSELLLIKAKVALIWYHEIWCKEYAEKEAIRHSPDRGVERFFLTLGQLLFNTETIFEKRKSEVQNLLQEVNKALKSIPVEGFLDEIDRQACILQRGYFEGRLQKIIGRAIEIIEKDEKKYEYLICPKKEIRAEFEEWEREKRGQERKNQALEKKIQDLEKKSQERERQSEEERQQEKQEREEEKQELRKELEDKIQEVEKKQEKENQKQEEEKQELKKEFENKLQELEEQRKKAQQDTQQQLEEVEAAIEAAMEAQMHAIFNAWQEKQVIKEASQEEKRVELK